ncbi:MAG: tRNA glutamyl-Q(34) synthetase GluQRS [Burkholderiales bacterium]
MTSALPRNARYRGRFAPSPTGPLHFGSLIAALGSFLDARANGGDWLVRIEDLDPPREIPGAADRILSTLDAFGLEWTGKVLYQSTRHPAYEAALDALRARGTTYRCYCTRKEIADAIARRTPRADAPSSVAASLLNLGTTHELVYPGTCRASARVRRRSFAERVHVDAPATAFQDAVQGTIEQELAREVGDFVVKRADGLFAYQLAVVVDDAYQGITDVVRGADLLDSTPRQIFLGRALGYAPIQYLHLPVAVNASGEKLSKQTRARAIDPTMAPAATLCAALRFLGQDPPRDAISWAPREVLTWGVVNWQRAKIPRTRASLHRD